MILLIDDRIDDRKDKRILSLKDFFDSVGMPSTIIKSVNASDYTSAFAAFLFAPSEDYLKSVSVRCKRIPILAVNESRSRIYNNDVLFYDLERYGTYETFIADFLYDRYGITYGNYRIGDLSISGNTVSYGVNRIKLTPSERRILVLLMLSKNQWISEDVICKVCFDGNSKISSVAVHICNMNKKFRLSVGKRIIQTKRFIGYMINEREV